VNATTKPRAIKRIGDAMLILADCREWLASVPACFRADAMITDPPYGIGLEKKTSDFRGSKHFDAGESLRASKLYDDDPDRIRGLIREVIPAALAITDRALVFSGPAMLWEYPEPASIGSVFTPNGAGRTAWGFQCTHPVLFYGKDPYLQDGKGGRPNSHRDEQPNNEKVDHPCPKPVAWMRWAVSRASRIGETILDPFMGSGTTGVACAGLSRKFVGIEIEPRYFDIACKRIEDAYRQGDLFIKGPVEKAGTTEGLL
jgi:site-specific DNA-methyltransferase (adenine-specific)